MKHFAALLASLTFALCFLLVGCANNKPNPPIPTGSGTKSGATDAPQSTEKPADSDSPTHTHAYGDWEVVTHATCRTEGQMKRTCSCGKTETSTIKKTDHNFVNHVCLMCNQRDSETTFVPDYTAGKENTVGNTAASIYALQDGWIYARDRQAIVKCRIGSDKMTTVYSCPGKNLFNVNVVGDWIYFSLGGTTSEESGIAKVRTDGQGFEMLLSSVAVGEMLVVKKTVYFTTLKEKYTDYAKDCAPLYSMSVNGGVTKQIHDGYVRELCANDTHVFFLYEPQYGAGTLCRMKHDGTSMKELLKKDIVRLAIGKDKLYMKIADVDRNIILYSIGTDGSAMTSIGSLLSGGDTFLVSNEKVFYDGVLADFDAEYGIILYDMSTKKRTVIHEEAQSCHAVAGYLLIENYEGETLVSVSQYDIANRKWVTVAAE